MFLVFDTQEKPTKFQVSVQSTNRPPTLSLYILLLIFRLLLQSGDVEVNPGPTLGKRVSPVGAAYTSIHVYAIELMVYLLYCIGSILMLSDLHLIFEKVIKAAEKWLNLGLALGLDKDTLSNIEHDYRRNDVCLREMLTVRLNTGPPLTYSEICQSLRARTVARNDVAKAIEETCTGMNSHEAISISIDRH